MPSMKSIYIPIFIALFLSNCVYGQVSFKQQKAFQNYINGSNAIIDQTYRTIECLHRYSEGMKKKGNTILPSLSCAEQIPSYHINTAVSESSALPSNIATALNADINLLAERYEAILNSCRTLEAYTKMKDYERDQFAKARQLIEEVQTQVLMLKKETANLELDITKLSTSMQTGTHDPKIKQASAFIHEVVQEEKALLDLFFLNFNAENFSNQFPAELLQKHVNNLDIKLANFKFANTLPYPANYQFDRFMETLKKDMQEMKRNLINGYTAQEQNDDIYANKALESLINYYNNLISTQNAFSDALRQHQLSSEMVLYGFKFFPVFRYNLNIAVPKQNKVLFKDKAIEPIKVNAQVQPISADIAAALNNYVRFINRSLQINEFLPFKLKELNQSCNRLLEKGDCAAILANGYLYYSDISSNYHIPKAEYEKAINDGRYLPPLVKKSLQEQASALMDILKEQDQLLGELAGYCKNKEYKKDCLNRGYEILNRFEILIESFHQRKERLYNDLIKVNDSYKVAEPNNSWILAGKALWETSQEYKKIALSVRAYLQYRSQNYKSTDTLEKLVRDITYDKYKNLKGIHELGRNNGHCPYSHYDDVPKDCQTFIGKAKEFEKRLASNKVDSTKLYDEYLYLYNSVSDDYNDFVEIARGDAEGYYEIDKYNPKGKNLNYMYLLEQIEEPMYFRVQRLKNTSPPETTTTKQTSDAVKDTTAIETSMEGYADNNLVLLIDVSYSMNQPDKMPLLKQSLSKLLKMLRPSDKISIVAFSNTATILLKPTNAQSSKIEDVIAHIKTSGGTNINAGMTKAYQVAQEGFIVGGNNRIVLATDGEFVISGPLTKQAESQKLSDIKLSVFSYGRSQASESLKKLSDLGGGNYELISPDNSDIKLVLEAKAKKK